MKYIKDEIHYEFPLDGELPAYTDFYGHLQEVYGGFGISYCNWNEEQYPNLAKHKERLIDKFDREYKFREIGQETGYRFMHFLQIRLDEVAEHYDHVYKVFAENNVDELGTGYSDSETYNNTSKDSAITQDNTTNTSKYKDTPISGRINNPTTETEDVNIGSTTITGESNSGYNLTRIRTKHDEHMIDELNRLADKYKSIDNEFIKGFNEMFMGIMYTEV